MATAAQDWSGGASYFDATGPSLLPASAAPNDPSAPSDWDLFWNAIGATSPYTGDLSIIGDAGDAVASGASAAGSAVGSAASAVGGALTALPSEVASAGKWLIVALILLAVIVVAWKV